MSAEAASPGSELSAAAAATREAAKWLVAAFAAVGAVLVSGLSLTDVGELDDDRLSLALLFVVVAVTGVLVAILLTVDVLLPSEISFEEVVKVAGDEHDEVAKFIRENPQLLEGIAPNVGALRVVYDEALKSRWETAEAYFDAAPDNKVAAQATAEAADGKAATINAVVGQILDVAALQRLREKFKRRRPWLVASALAVAVGSGGFAWASNPPKPGKPATADLRGANLEGADLSGVSLRGANLTGMTLKDVDLLGTVLDDAKLAKVDWDNARCPDGVNSDNAGDTCAGHLFVPTRLRSPAK